MGAKASRGKATYFRLSKESWDQILAEYMGGAKALDLSERWRVSPGTIYRRAREAQVSKYAPMVDEAVRARVAAMDEQAAEEAAADEARAADEAAMPLDLSTEGLMEQARTALARAMAGGRLLEAAQAARVLDMLGRLAPALAAGTTHGKYRFTPHPPDADQAWFDSKAGFEWKKANYPHWELRDYRHILVQGAYVARRAIEDPSSLDVWIAEWGMRMMRHLFEERRLDGYTGILWIVRALKEAGEPQVRDDDLGAKLNAKLQADVRNERPYPPWPKLVEDLPGSGKSP